MIGRRHSEESINKMRVKSPEELERMRAWGRANRGQQFSKETIAKLCAAKRGAANPSYGRPVSEETRAKHRLAKLGPLNGMWGVPAPNKGKRHKPSTLKKMRRTHLEISKAKKEGRSEL
jgi:hypothetical protein